MLPGEAGSLRPTVRPKGGETGTHGPRAASNGKEGGWRLWKVRGGGSGRGMNGRSVGWLLERTLDRAELFKGNIYELCPHGVNIMPLSFSRHLVEIWRVDSGITALQDGWVGFWSGGR